MNRGHLSPRADWVLWDMVWGLLSAPVSATGRPESYKRSRWRRFMMNSTELATVSRYNLPVVQLVLNNRSLGMVRQSGQLFYNGRVSYSTLGAEVDFIKLADAYGIKGSALLLTERLMMFSTETFNLDPCIDRMCYSPRRDGLSHGSARSGYWRDYRLIRYNCAFVTKPGKPAAGVSGWLFLFYLHTGNQVLCSLPFCMRRNQGIWASDRRDR